MASGPSQPPYTFSDVSILESILRSLSNFYFSETSTNRVSSGISPETSIQCSNLASFTKNISTNSPNCSHPILFPIPVPGLCLYSLFYEMQNFDIISCVPDKATATTAQLTGNVVFTLTTVFKVKCSAK